MTSSPVLAVRRRKFEAVIRARANYGLAVLGMAIGRLSGRFFNIRSAGDRITLRRQLNKAR